MNRLTGQARVLITTDCARALAERTEKLGFETAAQFGNPPGFAIIEHDGCRVMIGGARAAHQIMPCWQLRPGLWNACSWVRDVAALYAEMKQRGAIIDCGLEDQPCGVRGFGVRDPDGHDIGFPHAVENTAGA